MKLPLSWINDWIDHGLSTDQLAERLTMAGIEVDQLERASLPFEGVVVGEVLETKPHPEADRLQIATVSDGAETFQVVCGAANCRKGLKTPFARVGARLTDSEGNVTKIKRGKLRGIESQGMLCAAEELQLGQESTGIAELPQDAGVGQDLAELYGDWILEVSLTPNLGHCSSVLGIARELAAITEKSIRWPTFKIREGKSALPVKVTVKDREGCPKYSGRVIRGVKVGPSPDWLRTRLERSGIRSISNVVDATNYVMLELGQPLHAFDLAKVAKKEVVVRRAKAEETLTTLDGTTRRLMPEVLVICDAKGPLAIAGVMGGMESEVSEETTDVFLEGAYFDPGRVRRSSKALGLSSESHRRFERGVDPNGVLKALDRAASLIAELAGGEVQKGVIDSHPDPFLLRRLPLRVERTNALLGISLTKGEVEKLLGRLDFVMSKGEVTIPSYRSDVTAEIDLIEEVARLYGYDKIEKAAPTYSISDLPDDPDYLFEQQVRRVLLGEGLQELVTTSLISPKEAGSRAAIPLVHPSSIEQSVLRPSLLPSLLQVARHNQHVRLFDLAGFEIGKVYQKEGDHLQESGVAGLILSGGHDFTSLKGIAENLFEALHIPDIRFVRSQDPTLHPGRQAEALQGNRTIGTLGEIHPSRRRLAEVEGPLFFAELSLEAMRKAQKKTITVKPLPSQPSSERDWTVTLPEGLPVGELLDKIRAVPSRLLEEVKLIDIYTSEKLGKGKKNVTVRMVYRDAKKTVSASQVEADHARIIKEVQG